jgi:rhodanese-related sulfurtransferase
MALLAVLGLVLALGVSAAGAAAKEAPLISQDELKAALGKPGLVVIDVRYGKDWTGSDKKIKGAVREEPDQVAAWAKKYAPDQEIVLYCA